MPSVSENRFPFLDPQTRDSVLALPADHTTLRDAGGHWGGVITIEERLHRRPLEVPEYCTPGPRLHLPLDPVATVECRAHDQWHTGRLGFGDVVVVTGGLPTAVRWRESAFRVLDIHIDAGFFAEISQEIGSGDIPGLRYQFGGTDPQLAQIAMLLRDELAQGALNGRVFAQSLTTALAVHLLRAYGEKRYRFLVPQAALSRWEMRRAAEFIHDTLGENVGLDQMAQAAGMSPSYFSHQFKAATGLSPHAYLTAVRLEKAKTLLESTSLSVGEIAHRVGFYDQSHLVRHFRRRFQSSPLQIRRQKAQTS